MPIQANKLFKEAGEALKNHYGDRLDKILLFGSHARGEQTTESDIDLLVVLKDSSLSAGAEIRLINRFLFPIALHYGISISAHPVSAKKFESEPSFFFNRVRKEGIEL